MPKVPSKPDVLAREFLPIRAKLLEIAASLDRIDRAGGAASDDPRLAEIRQGLAVVQSREPNRAERLQMSFSLPYDDDWRKTLAVPG
ncbi:MAG: hypothetical protein ACYC35_07295 [Pirellulales bacterium]